MEAVSKPERGVFSPIAFQEATMSDLTDAGSEGSRVHPQDSVEDYTEAVPADKLQQPQLKKKSLIRSIKKGTSKRIKQLAQGTKELTEFIRSGSFAHISSGKIVPQEEDSLEKTGNSEEIVQEQQQEQEEDDPEQELAALKIQQAYRSFSDKKREVEEQKQLAKQQDDAAVKIQTGVRGYLARKESLKLQEIAAKVQEEVPKKKKPIRRVVVAIGMVAVVLFGIRKAL